MTPTITIERAPVSNIGVYGDLYFTDESHDDSFICHTIEREWLNNTPFISCIPNGQYIIEQYNSPKFGKCLIVYNEDKGVYKFADDYAQRYGILFHAENWCHKLHGCIAPVTGFKVAFWTRGKLAGYSSKKALNKLLKLLNGRNAKLILKSKEMSA